jgi:hypothetical protein
MDSSTGHDRVLVGLNAIFSVGPLLRGQEGRGGDLSRREWPAPNHHICRYSGVNGRVPPPVVLSIQAQVPLGIFERDPIGRLSRSWERVERSWPSKPQGDPALFHLRPETDYTQTVRTRLESYLGGKEGRPPALSDEERAAIRSHLNIKRTAIRLYNDEKRWLGDDEGNRPGDKVLKGIAATLCGFDALCDGAIVCLTVGEQQRLRDIVQRLVEMQDTGLGLPLHEVNIRTVEQLRGRRFQEVFVSREVNPATTPYEQMLRVLGSARVGLHLIRHPWA